MGAPRGVHRLNGSMKFVVNKTVKAAPGVLVKLNWREPSPNIFAPRKMEGRFDAAVDWTTVRVCPAMVTVPVRWIPELASNVKLTGALPEPLVELRCSQGLWEPAVQAWMVAAGFTDKTTPLL